MSLVLLLGSDSRHKGSNTSSIRSPVADEERSDHCLGSVLCVSFSALTLMVGWQEGHVAHIKVHFTNPQRFVSGAGGGGHEEELPDPGSPRKAAVK